MQRGRGDDHATYKRILVTGLEENPFSRFENMMSEHVKQGRKDLDRGIVVHSCNRFSIE